MMMMMMMMIMIMMTIIKMKGTHSVSSKTLTAMPTTRKIQHVRVAPTVSREQCGTLRSGCHS